MDSIRADGGRGDCGGGVMIVGHPTVTKRAYEQSVEKIARARDFAEAVVHNGLRPDGDRCLSRKQLLRLKAQIERDFLVSLLDDIP
jgi:hypothetical protein